MTDTQHPGHGLAGDPEPRPAQEPAQLTLVNEALAAVAKVTGLEPLHLDGAPIDFGQPPLSTALVKWAKKDLKGRAVKGSLRHICHLNQLNNLAVTKFGTGIEIIQPAFNTGVAASVGTHDFDMVVDLHIPGVGWWDQQRFFRANGLGSWYRHPPAFGNHIHGFTLPPREGHNVSDDFKVAGFKVGKYIDGGWSTHHAQITSSQIADYYHHAFGLKNEHKPNSDTSWFPPDIPTTIFDLSAYIRARLAHPIGGS
jgi:hypothetical protein